ncbi:MAG: class I SAM-dependent methyltransferase [Dehalococcoidia bacterium]|nr:class I SAM-dependent methyltransferase [SAR202 cluster bacterium]
MNKEFCPLCYSSKIEFLVSKKVYKHKRDFMFCINCELVFVPEKFHLSKQEQINRYLQHNNNPYDSEYRKFLSKIIEPLIDKIIPGAKGLDYGSGPGPTLSLMLDELGYSVNIYDIYFSEDDSVLTFSYDFITCSETAEHFVSPREEFDKLDKMLKNNGILAIMTSMLDSKDNFKDWYYNRDPTHLSFYTKNTMIWISNKYNYEISFYGSSVILFKKNISVN